MSWGLRLSFLANADERSNTILWLADFQQYEDLKNDSVCTVIIHLSLTS